MASLSAIVNTNTATPKGKQPSQQQQDTKMVAITADDVKYKRKYKDLKKRIRDIEEDNDVLNIKLSRARKNIHRLRVERSFLFDRLDQTGQSTNGSSSTSSSDTDSDDDRNGRSSSQRHGLDRLKSHHYRPYGTSLSNHHGSKSPPSRSSSVAGSVQHSANSSIGSSQIMDPSQASSPANGKRAIKKRRKDPLAPKRPSNAFFIFSQQHRQQAREEKKEGNQSELTKFLGQQWKSMPSTEKKIYSELAIQDRQRYLDEMSTYQTEGYSKSGDDGVIVSPKKKGKPGRPPKAAKLAEAAAIEASKIAKSGALGVPQGNGHAASNGTNGLHVPSINREAGAEEASSHDEDDTRMEATEDEDEEDEDDDEGDHDHERDHEHDHDDDEEEGLVSGTNGTKHVLDIEMAEAEHTNGYANGTNGVYRHHGGQQVDV
ncbi:non-histone protein [Podila clonocystis]|nr:non-histone protein [Podila clonocystis]